MVASTPQPHLPLSNANSLSVLQLVYNGIVQGLALDLMLQWSGAPMSVYQKEAKIERERVRERESERERERERECDVAED